MEEREVVERLEAAACLLEKTLHWLDERQGALSGDVERISATVEQSRREAGLSEISVYPSVSVVTDFELADQV